MLVSRVQSKAILVQRYDPNQACDLATRLSQSGIGIHIPSLKFVGHDKTQTGSPAILVQYPLSGFESVVMNWILAQDQPPPPLTPEQIEEIHRQALPWWFMFGYTGAWLFGLASSAFTLWMIWYCLRNDSERETWIWILLMFPMMGPIIYFIARWLPSSSFELPAFLRRWKDGGKIRRLEIAAQQIGNPHQFVEWGDALREVRNWEQAKAAYARALQKEPTNLLALWGAANAESQLGNHAVARGHLEKLLAIDPGYKFGDVSLLYGRTLRALNEADLEVTHWRTHLKKWRHPEALYLLAERLTERSEFAEARQLLETMIADIEVCPKAIARRVFFWRGRARKLLKRIPESSSAAEM